MGQITAAGQSGSWVFHALEGTRLSLRVVGKDGLLPVVTIGAPPGFAPLHESPEVP